MENKTKSRENKSHNISKPRSAIRAEPALSLYGDLLSYYPHIKFSGITFDNRMTFTKHFEEILECCNQKFHRLRILVNKKWGPSSETTLQIYKQCVRPIFEYGIVSTITVSETVITKIQRVQNSFFRLALRLPTYVSARLLHEASGIPFVRERLITVGQNHLARMHANPFAEHTINSARTNPGGGELPYEEYMGVCHELGSYFQEKFRKGYANFHKNSGKGYNICKKFQIGSVILMTQMTNQKNTELIDFFDLVWTKIHNFWKIL